MNLSDIKLKVTSLVSNVKTVHVVIFIGLIILIQAVWAYQTLTNSGSKSTQPQTSATPAKNKTPNTISLVTAKSEFKVGEKIPVTINITSDKRTVGADLVLKYDPNLLSVVITSAVKVTARIPVAVENIYEDYPVNSMDEKLGLVSVSGITSDDTGVIASGVFGTIAFQAKAAGNARIFLEFTKGKTNDTNIIENQTASDILDEVKNLDLRITP